MKIPNEDVEVENSLYMVGNLPIHPKNTSKSCNPDQIIPKEVFTCIFWMDREIADHL